jgi:hypothetical protein
MITGISPATVQLRLWLIPIVGTGVMVIAVLARAVSGRWWVGPVAAGQAFAGQVPRFGVPVEPTGGGLPVSLLSPSQTFVVPLFALLVLIAVDVLRGRPMRGGWGFLPVLAVACAGAKSSALPAFAAGVALAGLILLVRLRRVPWAAAGLLAVAGCGMAVGLQLFAGGGAGTLAVQPLSVVRWMTPYVQTLGAHDGVTKGGLFPPGVASAAAAGRWFVAGLVVWWVLMQAPRLIGLILPPRRRTAETGDPALWLVAGILAAGTGAMWLFWHPSQSQIYFFAGVVPFGAVLTVWALADRVRRWPAPVAGAAAGALWSLLAPPTDVPAGRAVGPWAWALLLPLLTTAVVTVVVAGAASAIWGRRALRNLPAGLLAAVVGAGLAIGAADTVRELSAPPPGQDPMRRVVTAAEMRAALWLDANAGDDDVVATNVHCMPMNAKVCDSRAFWVAGLGGRRTLVESWAYTDAAVAANGTGGRKYFYQPAPGPAVYDLNERVFRYGDPADTARLRDEFGVRWLLADVRAGAVAPNLAAVATVRYTDGPATVYELR